MVSLPNSSALPTFTLFNMCKRAHRNLCLHLFTTILTSGVLEQDCQYMQKWAHENTQRANRAARLQNSDQQIQMAYTLKEDKYRWSMNELYNVASYRTLSKLEGEFCIHQKQMQKISGEWKLTMVRVSLFAECLNVDRWEMCNYQHERANTAHISRVKINNGQSQSGCLHNILTFAWRLVPLCNGDV